MYKLLYYTFQTSDLLPTLLVTSFYFISMYNCFFFFIFLGFLLTESGLPGVLFIMLDTEMDKQLIKDIHETLISMLQMLAVDNLSKWINLCKSVLTISSGTTINI